MLVSQGCALREDLFPLVIATIAGEPAERDLRTLFGGFERMFARGDRYALIVDLRELVRPGTAAVRQAIAEWCLAHREPARRLNVCTSVVGAGTLVRGALTALNWLAPFVAPLHHESSLTASVDHCMKLLKAEGAPLPIAAEQFRQQLREARLSQRA